MKQFMLYGGILTMIVVVAWISIAVYDASVNIEVNPNAEQHMQRIKPTFDIEIIRNVEDRIKVLQVSPKILRALENAPEPTVEDEDVDNNDTNNGE